MELLARARIVMWQGASLWIVDATPIKERETKRTDFHAHHAVQVTLALDGWFRLDTKDAHVRGDAAAVAADTQHAFEPEGLMALIFIEPESRTGRAVARRLFDGAELVAIPSGILGDLRKRIAAAFRAPVRNDTTLVGLGRELVAALSGDAIDREPDVRIRKVVDWAALQIDEPVGLSDAVAVSGLSASRLRHLFVEQTGLPFKTYLLWLRLTRAVERFAAGASLTQAAHDAGFSDSAHLSRTFRRMFGVAPANLRMV
jgi:AraC family transcriptional regulator